MKETKFKQTEVGMIPSDWMCRSLGELCKVQNGYAFRSEKFATLGNTVIRISDIEDSKVSLKNTVKYPLSEQIPNQFVVRKGNFLIAMSGATTGKIGLYENANPALINQRVGRFDVTKKEELEPIFLFHLLRGDIFTSFLQESLATGAQPNISGKQIESCKIPLPSTIEEQQRIANALSDVDTLIANLEKLIAKKKNIKQGAMQQLLTGKKRLPGFAPAKQTYKQTELGQIPTDWEFVPVSELAKDMADGPFGSNLKKEHYTSDPQARIIQLSNIGENGWEDENTKYTTFEHAKTIARCIVPKEESILVAKMMPAGRAIICPKIEKQYVLGSDVIRITANEKLNSKYFVYASKSDVYLKQISDNTQGSTRQRTSISKLRKILILLPSLDEQTAIANILSDMDTEIATLETKLAKYRTLKTGMMQQLLTGKIRLL